MTITLVTPNPGTQDDEYVELPPWEHDDEDECEDELPVSAAEGSTWSPVNLAKYLDGSFKRLEPAWVERLDGVKLFYDKKVHWIQGEPESGKSWLAMIGCTEALMAGERVLYVDFEDDASTITERLLLLGATPEQLLKLLTYIRPDDPLDEIAERRLLKLASEIEPKVFVVDGVEEGMGTSGYNSHHSQDFYTWWLKIGKRVGKYVTGPTFVIDHVVKDAEARGKWATGTGQKRAKTDVQYGLTQDEHAPIGRGLKGTVAIWLYKDKPGSLKKYSKNHYFGRLVLDNTHESKVKYWIEEPRPEDAIDTNAEDMLATFQSKATVNAQGESACEGAWMTLKDIRAAQYMTDLDAKRQAAWDKASRTTLKKLSSGDRPSLEADVHNGIAARWRLITVRREADWSWDD